MATAENTLPKFVKTVETIGREVEHIGQVMQQATADIQQGDRQAKGFAGRVLITRRLAHHLSEPAERVWSLGNDYASQLHDIDQGLRVIIKGASEEIGQNPNSKADVCAFFDAVRSMSRAAHDGLDSTQQMIDAIAPVEKISRDLRPVLRRLRQGLTMMVEAREVSDEWVQLIDSSGIECGNRPVEAD